MYASGLITPAEVRIAQNIRKILFDVPAFHAKCALARQ
jgi:hypothetical protein